jgi:hypothetical protein
MSDFGIVDTGTAQSATSTTLQLRAGAAFANDELIGATIVIVTATTGAGQSRIINDYTGATDTATVDAWVTTPTGTITYNVFGTPPGDPAIIAADIRSAMGLASANLDTQLAGLATQLTNIQARLPAALVSGRIDSSVGAMAANTITAASTAADYVTELTTAIQALLDGTLADSVPADGTRPSISSGILMITRFLMEASVSGTTVTIRKENGVTTSMTFTLDDPVFPTSITRTT